MGIRIIDIKCNGFSGNMSISEDAPVFSYLLKSDDKDCYQSAYRILVSHNTSDLESSENLIWDSGKVFSPKTWGILYGGESLEELSNYYYKIYSYINGDPDPISSEIFIFGTALINVENIDADWIGSDSLLRKKITLARKAVMAKIVVTGLGYFELHINGEKIGEDTLSPSYTWYEKRIEYNTYDITKSLIEGENAIGIVLASHWKQSPDWKENNCYQGGCYYCGPLKAKAFIKVIYEDGVIELFKTDDSWKCTTGPVVYSSIYDGEFYDSRLEKNGFSMPDYNDADWGKVTVIQETGAKMVCSSLPLIKRISNITPQKIIKLANGDFTVDFGVNIAGRCILVVVEPRDTVVTIRHAEVINADGSINQSNLRWAKACDTYISNGISAVYEPKFTYHGFRYAQISGITSLSENEIILVEVRSSLETTGYFESSDKEINYLHEIMVRTLSNNMHSIPTDCCQRDERQGWMGDGQLSSEAICANFDAQYFYRKWLDDIMDCQDKATGNIPFVTAPAWAGGEALAWTCASYEIAYSLLRFYDDLKFIEKYYVGLCKYFSYLNSREDENGLLTLRGLCDWLATEPTEEGNIRDALYYRFAVVLKEFACVLDKQDDFLIYQSYAEKIKIAYNEKYYSVHPFTDRNSGYYGTCYYVGQTANALPLSFKMVNEKDYSRVVEKLVYELTESMGETRLTTGFIGTKAMFEALMMLDCNQIAYDLLKRKTYPSWGFMIANGATTVWERWQNRVDNEMNSHCHPPLAAPDVWFYRIAAGIREYKINHDGICEFVINPDIDLDFYSVKAKQKTPFGEIAVSWHKDTKSTEMDLEVPENTLARVKWEGIEKVFKSGSHNLKIKNTSGEDICS